MARSQPKKLNVLFLNFQQLGGFPAGPYPGGLAMEAFLPKPPIFWVMLPHLNLEKRGVKREDKKWERGKEGGIVYI